MKRSEAKGRPPLERDEALALVPVKNRQVTEQRHHPQQVVLHYPVTVKPWVAGLLRRFGGRAEAVRTRKVQLDELGTAVWDMVDGRRTVRDIVAAFAAAYRLVPREAEVSVTQFLRMLGQRGLIGMR